MIERKTLLELRHKRWVPLFPGREDVRVELVPAAMPDMTMAKVTGQTSASIAREICTHAFVDFEGWVEDGQPIENTLEHRLEFYSFPTVKQRINTLLESENVTPFVDTEDLEGEVSAAND